MPPGTRVSNETAVIAGRLKAFEGDEWEQGTPRCVEGAPTRVRWGAPSGLDEPVARDVRLGEGAV